MKRDKYLQIRCTEEEKHLFESIAKKRKMSVSDFIRKAVFNYNENAITFFDTREELAELTGLSMENHCSAMWDAGFDLDDWDFGFVSETEWNEDYCGDLASYYHYWLLMNMENHCCGYKHTEYNGKHYYIAYHS